MAGLLRGTRRALLGKILFPYEFDLALTTFTAACDKRLAPGPFYTAPIVQGALDGTGVPDVVTYPRGDLLANQTQFWYANFDPYQFTAIKWWTAETASADRAAGYSYVWYVSADYYARYDYANSRFEFRAGGVTHTQASAILAGTTYFVVFSADTKHSIDGTNLCRSSIDNVHNYGGSGLTASAPDATIAIGSDGSASPASAIIEGLTWLRRILTDGDGFGTNIGVDDEIEDIYAAGAGADPTLITGGAFDVVACMPTNSTDEELVSGPGEMWSMPHADSIPDVTFMEDGGLPGTPYAVEFNGTNADINFGSGATLDDLPDAAFTARIWVRVDGETDANPTLIQKSNYSSTGWVLRLSVGVPQIVMWGTSTLAIAATTNIIDGKFHEIAATFDDGGDRRARVYVDGVLEATSAVMTGAYQSEAVEDLLIGNNAAGNQALLGAVAWAAVYDAIEFAADYIPLRTAPAPGGNLVESWHMDEGTGVTAAAQVTVPGNNGTITNPATPPWTSIWQVEGTPVVPQGVEFFEENDGIDFGSGANIDDLPSADCTIEFWARIPEDARVSRDLFAKSNAARTIGWSAFLYATGTVRVAVFFDNTDAVCETASMTNDGIWHHYVLDWDQGTLTARLFVDGILNDTETAVGNYDADAAEDCLVNATGAIGTLDTSFAIGPIRLSDNRRYTGTYFVPPDRVNWVANDANAHLLVNMDDGAGATATDTSGNGYNGTITFGATTRWHNTPDMAVDEPGARVFNNGYNIGSDGAADGITDIETVIAETDYVIRPFASPGQSGRAWIEWYLWDNIGAAQIGATFSLPRFHDVHTGGAASAVLVNANGSFTQQLIGWLAYNIDDGSVGTITAVSGDKTTITAPLAGGGSNDWQNGEEYILRPPGNAPYARYPVATEGIFVFRTPVACVSMDIKVRNAAGEGVMGIHQVEMYESLFTNGDHETLTGGNPDLITTWTNSGLDAGDTQASSGGGAVIHAGAEAMQWNVGASNERMYDTIASAVGRFVSSGYWHYGDGAQAINMEVTLAIRGKVQYSNTVTVIEAPTDAFWRHVGGVWRMNHATPRMNLEAEAGAVGSRYTDDAYAFTLPAITITVTPANQANSLEGTGIRVVGRSTLTQPAPVALLTPTAGEIQFYWTPRHTDDLAVSFGHISAWLLRIDGGANNFIDLVWNIANSLRMQFNADGAGVQIGDWATGGGAIVVGVRYPIRISYGATWMRLYVDGVRRTTIFAPTGFAWTDPMSAYWGSTDTADFQSDAVYS